MTDKQRKAFALAGVIAFLALSITVAILLGKPIIEFVKDSEAFHEWIDARGIGGRLAFLGISVLQIIVAIIPGEPLEIGAGYAFGVIEGTALCLFGALIGGALVFLFVRCFGVKVVSVFYSKEKLDSLRFLRDTRKLGATLFFLMMIPGTPKDLLCYFAGLTKIGFKQWLFICTVARIPSIITSTIGGDALGVGKNMFALIAFGATLAISLSGLLIYRAICARRKKEEEAI